jgi:hypothetical protein
MEKKTGITFTPWETDEGTVLLLFLYIFDVFVYTLHKLSRTNFVNVISICKAPVVFLQTTISTDSNLYFS